MYQQQEVDEFALGDDEPEQVEMGDLYRGELLSLSARYEKEIAELDSLKHKEYFEKIARLAACFIFEVQI